MHDNNRGNRDEIPPRRIVVTGAASGIGLATTRLFLESGGQVVGLDRARPKEATGASHRLVDLRDASATALAVDSAVVELGGLDVLVACAGISYTGSVETTAPDVWDDVFSVNVRSVYLCARRALPHLRQGYLPSIVNVGSQFGVLARKSYVAYCASKAALIHLTRAMAVDHGPEGVRINAVCPGPTDTPMLRADATGVGSDEEVARVVSRTLPKRLSTPEEIANVIEFLTSRKATSMHGAVVMVDEGFSIY